LRGVDVVALRMSRQLPQAMQDFDVKPLRRQPENSQRTARDGSVNFTRRSENTILRTAHCKSHVFVATNNVSSPVLDSILYRPKSF